MREKIENPPEGAAESPGIGLYAESSLHSAVKASLCGPGDRREVRLSGRVVDILTASGEVVEVQTGNFGKIREKVKALAAAGHRVRIVYPVARERYIVKIDPRDGSRLSRRRSPKKGSILSLFDELVYFPELLGLPGVNLEVILVEVEELRTADGKGSWRRRFQSIVDKRLSASGERRLFREPHDLLDLLPPGLSGEFTSGELALALGCKAEAARRILYCLRSLSLAQEAGKRSRSILWKLRGKRKRRKSAASP